MKFVIPGSYWCKLGPLDAIFPDWPAAAKSGLPVTDALTTDRHPYDIPFRKRTPAPGFFDGVSARHSV